MKYDPVSTVNPHNTVPQFSLQKKALGRPQLSYYS